MVFSSVEFLLKFFPIFLLLYYLTPGKLKNVTLILGSFVFYASAGVENMILLAVVILADYGAGRGIGLIARRTKNGRAGKWLLFAAAVLCHVGLLIWFKKAPSEVLPIGLSFYTFQSLSYLTDVCRGEIAAEKSLLRYAAYISMFPRLTSGPIVYYSEVERELRRPQVNIKMVDAGLKQFVMGLVFKVLLADRIGILWHEIQTIGFISISTPLAWMGAYAYAMQIYFDFCGYSMMAVGIGKMLGFHLPENFDLPYAAACIRDFYRRWHITLGRWFGKYIYIPLGGNRKGLFFTILNLLAVWILTSVWHGSGYHFLIWGMTLWFFISLEKIIFAVRAKKKKTACGRLGRVLSHAYVWLVIPVTWLCFAIQELDQLRIYLGRMTGMTAGVNVNAGDIRKALGNYGALLAVCIFMCTPLSKKIFERYKDRMIGMAALAVLFWCCVYRIIVAGNNPFMYLKF